MGVTVRISGVKSASRRMSNVADNAQDLTRAWVSVGAYLSRTMRQQFVSEGKRLGTPWRPLKPEYKLWKIQNGFSRKILVRTGQMRDGFIRRPMDIEEYGPSFATFGSSNMKAVWMHRGTRRNGKRINPPRPILVATREVRKETRDIVARHIMKGKR